MKGGNSWCSPTDGKPTPQGKVNNAPRHTVDITTSLEKTLLLFSIRQEINNLLIYVYRRDLTSTKGHREKKGVLLAGLTEAQKDAKV